LSILLGESASISAKENAMSLKSTALAVLLTIQFAPSIANAACTVPKLTGKYLKPIPTQNINQALFSEAMQIEASFVRCRRGLNALSAKQGITRIATSHSKWMARSRKLSHTGTSKFSSRMKSTGIKFRTAAENIARFPRYELGTKHFRIKDGQRCHFARGGKHILPHSYASLARHVVNGWMGSSGHRKNLLNRRMKLSGAGLGFDFSAPHCGAYFITQDYSG